MGDNHEIPVSGSGRITLFSTTPTDPKFRSVEALYVPDMAFNLLSVTSLDSQGADVHFGGGKVLITDSATGHVLAGGERDGSLFRLTVLLSTTAVSSSIWHARFGHLCYQQLQQAARDSLVEGLPTVRSPTGICEPCQLGKQHRVAFPKQASTRASAPLALVHTDLCGPMSTSSLSGLCYMLVLVDDFSRYTWVSFMKLKSEAFGSIRDWKAMVEKEKDLKVKSIRSDRGGEFLSENFTRWCKSEGIRRQLTTPYTPSQNGVVERKNRTIMEMARVMLAYASLPRSYWAEACNTAVYIQNRYPTHALQDMTPFQAYYGRKPTVLHFRVFWCSAFVHIPKEKRQKLDFKSKKLLFLGYSAESDAYRLYDPDTRTTTVSRDVVFDESFITSAEGAAAQPIPILPPPSLPDPPASPVITPSTSHPVSPIQPPDVSPDHALSDSDSDLDVADATPEVDLAPPRREKRIPGWLYSTVASSGVTELPVPPPAGLPRPGHAPRLAAVGLLVVTGGNGVLCVASPTDECVCDPPMSKVMSISKAPLLLFDAPAAAETTLSAIANA
ncbi:hypothetical protein L7F22_061201 [Adiantum nelumboides]|nr:hypothetical protein [Adiantum nelumboides]